MIRCDNRRCKFNSRELCLNVRLSLESERCVCFKPKYYRQRKTNETDLNHKPVRQSRRSRLLK
nr:MAG TPA: hypothetical protein [Caudoviricetes sp.]